MQGSMLILTWVGSVKIMTNIMPTHVKISIEPGIRELYLLLSRTDISNLLLQFFEGTIFRCLTSSSKEAKISTFTVYHNILCNLLLQFFEGTIFRCLTSSFRYFVFIVYPIVSRVTIQFNSIDNFQANWSCQTVLWSWPPIIIKTYTNVRAFQQVTKETLIRGWEKTCIKECVDNCRLWLP
jgi:hypothetical protein